MRRDCCIALLALGTLLGGCAGLAPQTAELAKGLPPGLPARVELAQVPFFPQEDYQCGPAALATVLAAAGVATTPAALVPQVYLPERKGSLQVEMLATARRHGLVAYQLAPRYEELLRELAAGTPVVLLQNLGLSDGWHYAVAVGYDADSGSVLLRSGTTERQVLSFAANEVLWRRSEYWAMVATPPARVPASADEKRWLGAVAALERLNPASAREAYEASLARWPASVNALLGLANAHYALGELAQAEAALRRAAALAPDSPAVLNNLAQTLSDRGKNEEALATIERIAPGAPHADEIGRTRATILKRLGR